MYDITELADLSLRIGNLEGKIKERRWWCKLLGLTLNEKTGHMATFMGEVSTPTMSTWTAESDLSKDNQKTYG